MSKRIVNRRDNEAGRDWATLMADDIEKDMDAYMIHVINKLANVDIPSIDKSDPIKSALESATAVRADFRSRMDDLMAHEIGLAIERCGADGAQRDAASFAAGVCDTLDRRDRAGVRWPGAVAASRAVAAPTDLG